ncbi:MAG TPA: hypothetical protein VMT30_02225 [Candidatus Saccharimonadia bacterium]|nr:hypothetical protein [Candidatus Saccharimonadia bacterium]
MTTNTHRHVKSGKLISVLGRGHLEEDITPVVCYVDEADKRLWVRRAEIFDDGRFVPLTTFAWLIEHSGSKTTVPLYMCGIDAIGRFKWTYENDVAVRFNRQQDAEKVARGDNFAENHRVIEHDWSDSGRAAIGEGGGVGVSGAVDGGSPAAESDAKPTG